MNLYYCVTCIFNSKISAIYKIGVCMYCVCTCILLVFVCVCVCVCVCVMLSAIIYDDKILLNVRIYRLYIHSLISRQLPPAFIFWTKRLLPIMKWQAEVGLGTRLLPYAWKFSRY